MNLCPLLRSRARLPKFTSRLLRVQATTHLLPHRHNLSITANVASRSARESAPLIYPESPTKEHSDISSYISYAKRSGLDTSTTTYIGTHYEYTVAHTLQRFGFDLRRVGGAGDYGIDLLGTWVVPSTSIPLRVLLQCKASSVASKAKVGPATIRELEGAFVGAPPGWRGSSVVGLLVTQKTATKGVRDALGRSRWPMGFISCSSEGQVQQMIWNAKAEEQGLAGLGVGVRLSEIDQQQELVLTWKGQPILLKRSTLDLQTGSNQEQP